MAITHFDERTTNANSTVSGQWEFTSCVTVSARKLSVLDSTLSVCLFVVAIFDKCTEANVPIQLYRPQTSLKIHLKMVIKKGYRNATTQMKIK